MAYLIGSIIVPAILAFFLGFFAHGLKTMLPEQASEQPSAGKT